MNEYSQSVENIYKFEINNSGRIEPPNMVLPDCVIQRINFFRKYQENGMTFRGCMDFIVGDGDPKKLAQEFEFGAYESWLEVTDEFKKWYENNKLADLEIAVALIYGMGRDNENKIINVENGKLVWGRGVERGRQNEK